MSPNVIVMLTCILLYINIVLIASVLFKQTSSSSSILTNPSFQPFTRLNKPLALKSFRGLKIFQNLKNDYFSLFVILSVSLYFCFFQNVNHVSPSELCQLKVGNGRIRSENGGVIHAHAKQKWVILKVTILPNLEKLKKKSFVRNYGENFKFWFDLGSTNVKGRDPRTEFMLGKTINQSII